MLGSALPRLHGLVEEPQQIPIKLKMILYICGPIKALATTFYMNGPGAWEDERIRDMRVYIYILPKVLADNCLALTDLNLNQIRTTFVGECHVTGVCFVEIHAVLY